jgi:hypothetical protein
MTTIARIRSAVSSVLVALRSAWIQAFPMPDLHNPDPASPVASTAVLREGALLSVDVEARSGKRAA